MIERAPRNGAGRLLRAFHARPAAGRRGAVLFTGEVDSSTISWSPEAVLAE